MKNQTKVEPAPTEIVNSASNQMPTMASASANVSGAMSQTRKLMLAALCIHFVSLFLPYQDQDASGDVPILWNTGKIVHFQNQTPEQTGFELKPLAVFVIVGLLAAFATKFYQNAFWQRYGYWIALVLLLIFAFGGAPFRTTGGWLSLISLGLVIFSAYTNGKMSKQQKTM